MKTLFERLKDEHKEQLEEMKLLYPTSHDNLVKTLQEKYGWSDLTISEASTLVLNTSNELLTITNLSELFYE
jgi:hypothetical protein